MPDPATQTDHAVPPNTPHAANPLPHAPAPPGNQPVQQPRQQSLATLLTSPLARLARRQSTGPRPRTTHTPHDPTSPDQTPPRHIFCKRCSYDLSATHDLILCPECGRPFDHTNTATFDATPRQDRTRRAIRRGLVLALVALLITAGLLSTVIPRPISIHQPALWIWLNQPTGVQRYPTHGQPRFRITWLLGEPRAVNIYLPATPHANTPIARIERQQRAEDRFTLSVNGPGLQLPSLINAFNILRHDDEIFGIQWTPDQPRRASVAPFQAHGTMADIMAAIIGHYGIRITPLILDDTTDSVTIFLPTGVELPTPEQLEDFRRSRRANEHTVGPPAPAPTPPPIADAYQRLDHALAATATDNAQSLITGRLIRTNIETAEYLGYTIDTPRGPIILQRVEWQAAASGWH